MNLVPMDAGNALRSELPDRPRGHLCPLHSETQREASIDDQIRICRAEIERNGWDVVEVYADATLSGAPSFRTGYTRS